MQIKIFDTIKSKIFNVFQNNKISENLINFSQQKLIGYFFKVGTPFDGLL